MITITIIIIIDEICHLIINIYTLNYDFGKGVRSLLNKIMQGKLVQFIQLFRRSGRADGRTAGRTARITGALLPFVMVRMLIAPA